MVYNPSAEEWGKEHTDRQSSLASQSSQINEFQMQSRELLSKNKVDNHEIHLSLTYSLHMYTSSYVPERARTHTHNQLVSTPLPRPYRGRERKEERERGRENELLGVICSQCCLPER